MFAILTVATVATVAPLGSSVASAQAYPARPIRLIVPAAPGGGIDVQGRLVGQKLGEQIGQTVVIDNRGGANGIIGSEIVARSPPDGYTLLIASPSHTINASIYRKLPYDTLRDFAPISRISTTSGLVMVIHPSVPARNVAQFIAHARANPDKLVFGSPGIGNVTHLAPEWFAVMSGVRLVHVPYKGVGPAMNDLLAGHIPLMFPPGSVGVPLVKSGRLIALAVTALERWPSLPDVPTLDESGLKGFELVTWQGIFAPSKTPAQTIATLNTHIQAALQAPGMRERMANIDAMPAGNSVEVFTQYVREDIARWAKVVKAAGIAAQ
jgi:tripartite-type tricarboxylate transporter receptor subunit TctC